VGPQAALPAHAGVIPPALLPANLPALTASVASASPREDFTQVSKILTNMKPAEAAKIMSFLSDDQVEGIVRAIGVRQAALMLAHLPTERAAALSRRLMHPNPEHAP